MNADDKPGGVALRAKRALVFSGVVVAFGLGCYSLFLASARAGKVKPLAEEGLVRTCTAKDHDQIARALGTMHGFDVVLVVVDDPLGSPDLALDLAARQAAQILADSALTAAVRHVRPIDPDFTTVVEQNGIGRFPAVLAVRENGGIVLINEEPSPDNLANVFHTVWGKKSDCGAAKNAVY